MTSATNRPALLCNVARPPLATWWLILALALTVLVRGWLAREYVVLGDDTAYYLDYLRAERSEWWTHAAGVAYLWPFMLLGKYPGAWTAALLASVLPAIPLYLLARRVASPPAAILAALLFAWMPTFGALLASAWIVLLAITLALGSLHWLLRYYETHKGRYVALGILCGLTVGFTSPSAMLVFAPVFWLTLVYAGGPEEGRPENIVLWSGLTVVVAALGIIVANMVFGYSFHLKAPGMAILGVLAAVAAWYFGRRVCGPVGLIIVAMGGWAGLMTMLTVGHISFFGLGSLTTAFGRADLWILPPAMLVFAWGIGRTDFRQHPKAAGLIAYCMVMGVGVLWLGGFRAMAADHSTLTWRTLPVVAATAALPDDAVIGVHPHMLARHVDEFTSGKVLHTMPEGLAWTESVAREDAQVRCAMSTQTQDCGITHLLVKQGEDIYIKHISTPRRRDVAQ